MKNRPTTTLISLTLVVSLALAGVTLAQNDNTTTTSPERHPADRPCEEQVREHNNTTYARQRCAHDGPHRDAMCQRAAKANDNATARRCVAHDKNSDHVERCRQLARTTNDWSEVRRHCYERLDGNATLGILITQPSPNGPTPAPGATVIAYKIHRDATGFHVEPVERGQTNDRGTITFELPRGHYVIRAGLEDVGTAHKQVKLDDDQRTHLHLHKDKRNPDGPAALGIRAAIRGDDGHPHPAANAKVVLERYVRDDNATTANHTGHWEHAAGGTTDDQGLYATVLPKGTYRVTILSEDGELEGHKRFLLRNDKWVRVGLTSDGPTIQ